MLEGVSRLNLRGCWEFDRKIRIDSAVIRNRLWNMQLISDLKSARDETLRYFSLNDEDLTA